MMMLRETDVHVRAVHLHGHMHITYPYEVNPKFLPQWVCTATHDSARCEIIPYLDAEFQRGNAVNREGLCYRSRCKGTYVN